MVSGYASLRGQFFRAFVCGVAVLTFGASDAAQTATFTTQSHPLLGNTHAAADFNGDGRPDIALAVSGAGNSLNVLTNSFEPTARAPANYYLTQ